MSIARCPCVDPEDTARCESATEAEAAIRARIAVDPALRVVSFDLFDTLLQRPLLRPADLHACVGAEAASAGLLRAAPPYPALRAAAETRARKAARAEGRREPRFAEIVGMLAAGIAAAGAASGQDAPACAHALGRLELAAETRVLTPRPAGARLLAAARRRGLAVAVLSDMYLSSGRLAGLLSHAGLGTFAAVLSSADAGRRKHEGALFRDLSDRLGVAPGAVVHVGDDARSDVRGAARAGVPAMRLPTALETAARRGLAPPGWTVRSTPLSPRGAALIAVVTQEALDRPCPLGPASAFAAAAAGVRRVLDPEFAEADGVLDAVVAQPASALDVRRPDLVWALPRLAAAPELLARGALSRAAGLALARLLLACDAAGRAHVARYFDPRR